MEDSEARYNKAADDMDRLVDKGMNPAMAWEQVDPEGKIRKAEEERLNRIQDGINHIGAQATQQVGIDGELEKINAIADPKKREEELTYFKARQIAKKQIQDRGY